MVKYTEDVESANDTTKEESIESKSASTKEEVGASGANPDQLQNTESPDNIINKLDEAQVRPTVKDSLFTENDEKSSVKPDVTMDITKESKPTGMIPGNESPRPVNYPRSMSLKSSPSPGACNVPPRSASMKSASPRMAAKTSESISEDTVSTNYSVYSSSDTTSHLSDITDEDAIFSDGSGSNSAENFFDNFLKLVRPGVKYRKKKVIKLNSVPWRTVSYGNYIHCTLDDGIYVIYDGSGELVKTVKLQKIRKPRAIANDGAEIIVATKEGLHLLSDQGVYLGTIRDGKFSDVVLHGGFLYALEYKKKKIVTFQQQQDAAASKKWLQVKSIPLNLTSGKFICTIR